MTPIGTIVDISATKPERKPKVLNCALKVEVVLALKTEKFTPSCLQER